MKRTPKPCFLALLPPETGQTGTYYRGCALAEAGENQLLVDVVVTAYVTMTPWRDTGPPDPLHRSDCICPTVEGMMWIVSVA